MAAPWASQEGSLLLWLLLLSTASTIAIRSLRGKLRDVEPYALSVLLLLAAFFAGLLVFAAKPFQTSDHRTLRRPRLSPLLRYPTMMIHPPLLYSGYTLFRGAFAFGIGALAAGRVGGDWIVHTRRYALTAWLLLGVGIVLGARWSYAELGWGGYWAWDPVENASLLPWLTRTAFLHTIVVQERRGRSRPGTSASSSPRTPLPPRHVPRPLRRALLDPRLRRLTVARRSCSSSADCSRSASRS